MIQRTISELRCRPVHSGCGPEASPALFAKTILKFDQSFMAPPVLLAYLPDGIITKAAGKQQ